MGLIDMSWKAELHKYITGIVQHLNHQMLQINSVPDHLHMLVCMRPHQSISGFMQVVKSESSKWVNERRFCPCLFAWQEGYGAFSYSRDQVPKIKHYIERQEELHRKVQFRDEYINMLEAAGIVYKEDYVFADPL